MQLQSIKYSQFNGQPSEWDLDQLDLLPLNLIVGKNATGKTKTISLIDNLAKLLRGDAKPVFCPSCIFKAEFEDQKKIYQYNIQIEHGEVVEEELRVKDGENNPLLKREKDGKGKIYAAKEGKHMAFQVPISELAFVSRIGDNIQHPFVEPLFNWSKSVYFYRFGTQLGKNKWAYFKDDATNSADIRDDQMVIEIFKRGDELYGKTFKEAIRKDFNNIGYDIIDLGLTTSYSPDSLGSQLFGKQFRLWVKEKDLENKTEQGEISQGMFRALSLIIQLNFLKMVSEPSCILIDDIGEGLDYERSCALIELIIRKAVDAKFQLIMATNDRFVMNHVPLEYWTVLQREGKRCRVFNIQNSKEKFEDFKFTGLNNFDFFSTEFN